MVDLCQSYVSGMSVQPTSDTFVESSMRRQQHVCKNVTNDGFCRVFFVCAVEALATCQSLVPVVQVHELLQFAFCSCKLCCRICPLKLPPQIFSSSSHSCKARGKKLPWCHPVACHLIDPNFLLTRGPGGGQQEGQEGQSRIVMVLAATSGRRKTESDRGKVQPRSL